MIKIIKDEFKAVPEQYRLLKDIDIISETIYYEETDSTNMRAKDAGRDGALHGTLIFAEQQNAGRGRLGRSWDSPTGRSIYMSLLLRPQIQPVKAPMLTLVMAVSVAEGIKAVTGLDVQIKWPNDIVLNGRKICGILTEMSADVSQIYYVVIGVGINVNQDTFPEELVQTATSLKKEAKKTFSRAEIMTSVMEKFEKYYRIFLEREDLSEIQKLYNSILINQGREVRILEPGNEYNALALGINEAGELLVELPSGERKQIFAGEVSVRGLYGYV